jgi:hypothetical protein
MQQCHGTNIATNIETDSNMKAIRFVFTATMISVIYFACAPSTKVTGSWIAPEAKSQPENGKKVFIASLSRNMELRTKLETALANEASKRGIVPVKSTAYFTPEFYQQTPSEQQLIGKIKDIGVDAILTVSLIKKESENRYQPGNISYAPFSRYRWYGGFYSYYNYWYPYLYDPGYYVTDKTYFMETNLYDAASQKLLWSAQSTTINPGSINNFVKEYPSVLIRQMVKDGLLAK